MYHLFLPREQAGLHYAHGPHVLEAQVGVRRVDVRAAGILGGSRHHDMISDGGAFAGRRGRRAAAGKLLGGARAARSRCAAAGRLGLRRDGRARAAALGAAGIGAARPNRCPGSRGLTRTSMKYLGVHY